MIDTRYLKRADEAASSAESRLRDALESRDNATVGLAYATLATFYLARAQTGPINVTHPEPRVVAGVEVREASSTARPYDPTNPPPAAGESGDES